MARLQYEHNGRSLSLRCFDNWLAVWDASKILAGETYVPITFVDGVNVVIDVGANCGASTVFFATLYPSARVLALEPAHEPYDLLGENTRQFENVELFNIGLHAKDQELPLYHGTHESAQASIFRTEDTIDEYELVALRSTADWLREQSIEAIDVLKIDTEGCEVPILNGIRDLIPSIRIIYLEYHSADDRLELEKLLEDTHLLAAGRLWVTRGEVAYVARDAFPPDGVAGARVRDWLAKSVGRWSSTSPKSS